MNKQSIMACCMTSIVAAGAAWALATFQPQLVNSLPVGAIKTMYMKPLQFGLLVGVLVFVGGLVIAKLSNKTQFGAETYSSLLAPESYGYAGLAPASIGQDNAVSTPLERSR